MARWLRDQINDFFRTDSDLDAFVIDYCPEVANRLGQSTDRVARVNLLFQLVDEQELASRLQAADPHRRARGWLCDFPTHFKLDGDSPLARAFKACELRDRRRKDPDSHNNIECRIHDAPPPFGAIASIAYVQNGLPVRHGLAATSQAITLDLIDQLRASLDAHGLLSRSCLSAELVYSGPRPDDVVRQVAREYFISLFSQEQYEGLIDFSAHVEAQTRRLNADPVYPPSLYVPQRMQYCENPSFRFDNLAQGQTTALQQLMHWLHEPDRPCFILLLGDFGLGKTFLSHELCRQLGEAHGPLIPLLCDLRQLEKTRDLKALLIQYLQQHRIWPPDVDALLHMLALGRIVLFFDGFDELCLRTSYDRATEHMDTLLHAVSASDTRAKVVVTSRTQHFLSTNKLAEEFQDVAKTVLADRLYRLPVYVGRLLPFTEAQIHDFLKNRLGNDGAAAERLALIRDVQDLLGLSQNPRMLGFIVDLPDDDLRQARSRVGHISAAGLYQLLIGRWLGHEVDRADHQVPRLGLTLEQRTHAVTGLALRLWGQTERGADARDLEAQVRGFLDDLALATHQFGSGTLLLRDDAGRFSFFHESVLEWLVARAAAEEVRRSTPPDVLGKREMSPLMAEFFIGLLEVETAARWGGEILEATDDELGPRAEILKRNALHVFARLHRPAPERQNLARQDLRGRDFTGQSLRSAN